MKEVSTLGIDLAKNVFHLYGVDPTGEKVLSKKVSRSKFLWEIEKMKKGKDFVIGMEACGGSHHIARMLKREGYEAKMMAAKFVTPYVKSNKNDAKDAEAISEAVRKKNMRFVGVKTEEQQDIQSIHRVREGFVKHKTAIANEIRGLLLEYGITIPRGIGQLRKALPSILEDGENELSLNMRKLVREIYEEFIRCVEKVKYYDNELERIFHSNEDCKRIGKIEGVGIITATALVAAVGDPKAFKNGRQFSSWLGLTPRQYSTGGKTTLLGISKRGDCYLRKNLVHGCRVVVYHSKTKDDKKSRWIQEKVPSKGVNKVSVALANKTARVIWAILSKREEYRRGEKEHLSLTPEASGGLYGAAQEK